VLSLWGTDAPAAVRPGGISCSLWQPRRVHEGSKKAIIAAVVPADMTISIEPDIRRSTSA
jgi:hypothetical protein